jgi:hypothetical protein
MNRSSFCCVLFGGAIAFSFFTASAQENKKAPGGDENPAAPAEIPALDPNYRDRWEARSGEWTSMKGLEAMIK